MYRRILVPLDGSDLAEEALPHAADLARHYNSSVWLVRVNQGREYVQGPAGTVAPYYDVVMGRDQEAATAYLGRVAARLQRPGIRLVTEVLEGPVASAIVACAQAQNIDLIVMSSHGRSGLGRWVYGSVAYEVLRQAHCPTLVVRHVGAA